MLPVSCPRSSTEQHHLIKYRWSALLKVPCSVIEIKAADRCRSFTLPHPVSLLSLSRRPSVSLKPLIDCVANPHRPGQTASWKNSFIRRAAALCRVCEFHKVCEMFPGCVFHFLFLRLDSDDWQSLTDLISFDLISSQDLLLYFYSKESLVVFDAP